MPGSNNSLAPIVFTYTGGGNAIWVWGGPNPNHWIFEARNIGGDWHNDGTGAAAARSTVGLNIPTQERMAGADSNGVPTTQWSNIINVT